MFSSTQPFDVITASAYVDNTAQCDRPGMEHAVETQLCNADLRLMQLKLSKAIYVTFDDVKTHFMAQVKGVGRNGRHAALHCGLMLTCVDPVSDACD